MSELLSFQMVSMDSEEFSNMLMLHFIGILVRLKRICRKLKIMPLLWGGYNSSVSLMKYVEKRPYVTESEVTSPPTYIRDYISGEYSIYYANGDTVPSTYEECKNLEVCAVWELSHVIDRLMGDDKWQKCMAL